MIDFCLLQIVHIGCMLLKVFDPPKALAMI